MVSLMVMMACSEVGIGSHHDKQTIRPVSAGIWQPGMTFEQLI